MSIANRQTRTLSALAVRTLTDVWLRLGLLAVIAGVMIATTLIFSQLHTVNPGQLDEAGRQAAINPVFVAADPDNDDLETTRRHLEHFHHSIEARRLR